MPRMKIFWGKFSSLHKNISCGPWHSVEALNILLFVYETALCCGSSNDSYNICYEEIRKTPVEWVYEPNLLAVIWHIENDC